MAYQLNAAHPLAPRVVEIIGVNAGALVSIRTPRTFTKHASASYVSGGTYGEAFRTVGNGYTVQGANFTPSVIMDNTAMTLFIVANAISKTGGIAPYALVSSEIGYSPTIGVSDAGGAWALAQYNAGMAGVSSAATVTSGAHSVAITRSGEASHKLYRDGSLAGSATTALGYNKTSSEWKTIGGCSGQCSVSEDFVWAVWFDRVLTDAEVADLHASLGAGNAMGLIQTTTSSTVTGVVVAPASATLAGSATLQFAATVSGTGTPSQSVVWSTSAGSISSSGLLTAPAATTSAQSLTVTATSVQNGAFSGTASVTVSAASSSGQLVTDVLVNNSGTVQSNVSMHWTWYPSGRAGSVGGITPIEGTGVTDTNGRLTVSGLPPGTGFMILAQWVNNVFDDYIAYQPGTVS